MWNENSLDRMRAVYQEVDFAVIQKIWSKNTAPVGVYIHNPFCLSLCSFCAFKGRIPLPGEMQRYYKEYLPAQIKAYRSILEQIEVSSWYFGGGTPSLMDKEVLRQILALLPGIKTRGEKTFEIHPADFDINLLDVLQEYNFDNVIIGVQSFDKNVLEKIRRRPATKSQVQNIIQEIQRRGMNAWVDIVGFLNDDPKEIAVLGQDICTAIELQPEEISINLNFALKNKYLAAAAELFTTVIQAASPEWFVDLLVTRQAPENAAASKEEIQRYLIDKESLRLFNKKRPSALTKINGIHSLYCAEADVHLQGRSALGIGGYKNNCIGTMSVVLTGHYNYYYTEANESFRPQYFVTHTANFLEETRQIILDLKNLLSSANNKLRITRLEFSNDYGPNWGDPEQVPYLKSSLFVNYFGTEKDNAQYKKQITDYLVAPRRPFIDLSLL